MTLRLSYCALALAVAMVPLAAEADSLLLDVSPISGFNVNGSNTGFGQGVAVSTTTTLDGISFDVALPLGGAVKYLIFDGTDSTLLFSQTDAVAAASTVGWVESAPFSYTLNAGSTYYFGIIANNNLDVGYIYPPGAFASNGLTALTTGNSVYSNFSSPMSDCCAGAEIGLRLYGTPSSVAATPEPGSFVLLGSGLLAGAGAIRRRFAA